MVRVVFFWCGAFEYPAHDLADVASGDQTELLDGEVFHVDVFSFQNPLQFVPDRIRRNTGEFDHLIKESIPLCRFLFGRSGARGSLFF